MAKKLDPAEALFRKRKRDRAKNERIRHERQNIAKIVAENRRLQDDKNRSAKLLQQRDDEIAAAAATIDAERTLNDDMRSLLVVQSADSAAARAAQSQRVLDAAKVADDRSAELDVMQKRLSAEQRRSSNLTKGLSRVQSELESQRSETAACKRQLASMDKACKKRRHATIEERQLFLEQFDERRRQNASLSNSEIIHSIDPTLKCETAFDWLRKRESIGGHLCSKKMRSTPKTKHLCVDDFVVGRLRQLVGTDMIHLPVTLQHIITLGEWASLNLDHSFTPTISWARSLCKRKGLVHRKLTGTRSPKAPSKEAIKDHMRDIFNELSALGFKLENVWCGDEISFKSKLLRQSGFVFEGEEKLPLSKAVLDNTAFTALLFFNFQRGTRRPAVIWHGKDKPLVAGVTSIRGEAVPSTDLAQNKTAWMRRDIFSAILRAWDDELGRGGERAAVIIDNVSTHHGENGSNIGEQLGLGNLVVRYLLPNTTDVAQLNDTGCNRSVQAAKVRLYSEIVLHGFFSGEKDRLTCARGVKMLHAAVAQVDPDMPGRVARHLFGDLLNVLC